jgi:hypothetical protein
MTHIYIKDAKNGFLYICVIAAQHGIKANIYNEMEVKCMVGDSDLVIESMSSVPSCQGPSSSWVLELCKNY